MIVKPQVIKTICEMQKISTTLTGKIGFVPTMGYLHEGHLSLVKAAKENADFTVVSIYVNPSQFAPSEDLDSYPRDLERDIDLLAKLGVDYVFFPNDKEMYPEGYNSWITVEGISKVLCGVSRPSHFTGVATIVAKLVNIIQPHLMFMGEKDFQQIAVLSKMLKELNFRTKIFPCPIVREADGLAMSSRNKYLDKTQRSDALCLYNSIKTVKREVSKGNRDLNNLKNIIKNIIDKANGKIDYIEFRQIENLSETTVIDQNTRLFLAVYIGKTRLIDNSAI